MKDPSDGSAFYDPSLYDEPFCDYCSQPLTKVCDDYDPDTGYIAWSWECTNPACPGEDDD